MKKNYAKLSDIKKLDASELSKDELSKSELNTIKGGRKLSVVVCYVVITVGIS